LATTNVRRSYFPVLERFVDRVFAGMNDERQMHFTMSP
jgi:hypothetical protein